jgi:aminoglycoside phosphotransferase family enzyme/predicted kinase
MSATVTAPAADHGAVPSALAGPEVHETHTGFVVLVGDRAYKVKKPILTDFLDFRTVEARERVCAHEVLLNSRLAPDGYLGVGHFAGPRGEADEPVIVMRRYPEDRRLASLIRHGEPVEQHLSAIAELLARFHAGACRSSAVDADARAGVLLERWNENLDVLGHYAGSILPAPRLAEVQRLARQYLSGRAPLFASRIDGRRIVDGHGDLIADDIFCMPAGPVLLDCLEFDDHLRHLDGLDDAAFLAMDLDYLGRPDLAATFLNDYRRVAGDSAPGSLAHFYVAYRAVVRAKVDCIRVDQGQATAADDAQRHLSLAVEHLRAATVRMVIVGGGPGTGKTTLARELAERIGAVVLSTDDVRVELVASGELAGEAGKFGSGLYDPTNVSIVYDTVVKRAGTLLANGQSVILDGTWRDARQRQRAYAIADELSCPTVELACQLDIRQAVERIDRRGAATHSQATEDVAQRMHADEPTWDSAHHIDTSRALGDSVDEAVAVCCLAI